MTRNDKIKDRSSSSKNYNPIFMVKTEKKDIVFIFDDFMVNGFLVSRNINHRCIIKVRSFSGAKVRCMQDYINRDFNPDHIILHVGTNEMQKQSPEVFYEKRYA